MAKLSALIAPPFYTLHRAIAQGRHTHYWLAGGRGSTKSSFISIELILGLIRHPGANAVCVRKVGVYLKDSVYEQLLWAIEALGVGELWIARKSPLELVYAPTGQRILFRGADNPRKIKSTKVSRGYIRYVWFEEADEFAGPEEVRTINQSLMRGGEKFDVFYSYNPPRSAANWVNAEAAVAGPDKLVHRSCYLEVPSAWLGAQFIAEAERLRDTNPEAYRHEYMGEATGTGGEVFRNLELREISNGEIDSFGTIRRGLDWGYAADPLHYAVCCYDRTRRRLYIFFELHRVRLSNTEAYRLIRAENAANCLVTADSAEPKSIADLRQMGLRIAPARKGRGSVEHGLRFLSQELEKIVIDPARCPNTAREFAGYALEKDASGNYKGEYPDRDNHSIDAVRYALEGEMGRGGMEILK